MSAAFEQIFCAGTRTLYSTLSSRFICKAEVSVMMTLNVMELKNTNH